jgi:hypothetical protein
MKLGNLKSPVAEAFFRCAGPNCGVLKKTSDRWWLMWTSAVNFSQPVLYLCAWDEEIANREGTLHVCGELWGTFGKTSSGAWQNTGSNRLPRLSTSLFQPFIHRG